MQLGAEQRATLPLYGIPIGIEYYRCCWSADALWFAIRDNHICRCECAYRDRVTQSGCDHRRQNRDDSVCLLRSSVTRNPWNIEHSPGGSVQPVRPAAARMCFAALGTQTGGSITRPASFCGVASFKRTRHRWPTERVFPIGENLDHVGPHSSGGRFSAAVGYESQLYQQMQVCDKLRPTR